MRRSSAATANTSSCGCNSGEQRLVHGRCMATIGAVSNPDHMNISIGKAGRKRWMGRMPHNRGVAMNPVDHPHGGGEGRTSGGRHPVTPWGFPTKGKKTRKNKSTTKFIMSSRHAARRRNKETSVMARSVWKGPFVDGYLLQEGGGRARVGPARDDQDLEPPLDHPAAIRRPDLRRLQRPEAHPGAGDRGNGRPQVRRVRADPHVPRPFVRPQGQAHGRPERGSGGGRAATPAAS